jgi:hypothetical protein
LHPGLPLKQVRRAYPALAGGHWGGGMFINAYDMARFG